MQRVDNLSYCVTMDNNTAQLYISWKEDDLNYYLQRVDAFLLSRPEDFKNFRKQVRNVLDWGKGTRLEQIKKALDVILEENRKRASEAAKSRQPPSEGSATSSSKKPKSSSSRRNSSRSNSVQVQNGGANELEEWDETVSHADAELSCPPQLQSFVDAGDDTTPQDTDEGLALPEYPYPEDDQQHQGQVPVSFGFTAEPAGFATSTSGFTSSLGTHGHGDSRSLHGSGKDRTSHDTSHAAAGSFTQTATSAASAEEQPSAASDDYWTWSDSRQRFYHLNEDGSREWYKKPQRGSRK